MSHPHHFIPASTTKVEGIAATGKGISIAPACGGSVEAQIERSTHLIAQRLGCSPQAIQKLAGLQPSASKASHVYEIGNSPTSGRRKGKNNNSNNNNVNEFGDSPQMLKKSAKLQQQQQQASARNPMIASVKKEIDDIKPLSLPPLPQQFQPYGGKPSNKSLENEHHTKNGATGNNSARGGLTIAQQQAAFLDDAEAARQFAAQLRYREAMLEQRKVPGVGQYNIPSVVGADRSESIYSRAPHVSLDGQTPRSGRFMFNVDLFENGAKRPGPGEYFHSGTSSAYQKTVAGRDRGMRKKLPIERVNARMNIEMKSPRK